MIAIAGGVAWVGYWLFTYGLSQVMGQNYGLLDLAWPSRFPSSPPAADSGSPGGGGATAPCPPGYVVVAGRCVQSSKKSPSTTTGSNTKAQCAKTCKPPGTCVQDSSGQWYCQQPTGH